MTNEEAIERIDFKMVHCNNALNCDWECEKCSEAESMVKEALEKQIPKKLAILPEPYINAKKYGCCPTCQWTEIDYRWGMREGTTITYCPRCGQALLWEIENGID